MTGSTGATGGVGVIGMTGAGIGAFGVGGATGANATGAGAGGGTTDAGGVTTGFGAPLLRGRGPPVTCTVVSCERDGGGVMGPLTAGATDRGTNAGGGGATGVG